MGELERKNTFVERQLAADLDRALAERADLLAALSRLVNATQVQYSDEQRAVLREADAVLSKVRANLREGK